MHRRLLIIIIALVLGCAFVWAETQTASVYLPLVVQMPTDTPTSTPIPTATSTPVPQPTPTNAPAPTATSKPQPPTPTPNNMYFGSVQAYRDTAGNIDVAGEMINGTNNPLYFNIIAASFYDANHTLMGTTSNYAYLSQVLPHHPDPYKLTLTNASPAITTYELQGQYYTGSTVVFDPITIVLQQERENSGVTVFGTMRNDQATTLVGIELATSFYDAAGNITWTQVGIPTFPSLNPGAGEPYNIDTFWQVPYSSFLVQADGYQQSGAAAKTPLNGVGAVLAIPKRSGIVSKILKR